MSDQVLIIKVTLNHSSRGKRKPFRVIAVNSGTSLYDFAKFIVFSFGFDFDHPFGFYDNVKRHYNSTEGYELFSDLDESKEFNGVRKTKVGKVYDHLNKKMLFLFDYGDEWAFITELLRVRNMPKELINGEIVERFGIAPKQYGDEEEE